MTALRFRGIRYWWAGIGISVLAFLYVGPIAAALRQHSFAGPTTPLTALTVPSAALPLLRVPTLHRLAPLPPLHAAKAAGASHTTSPTAVRSRVPVVTDSYSLVGGASGIARTNTPVDLFQSTPTVSESVGAPVQLPATPAPAAAPTTPAAPAVPADTPSPDTQPAGDATPTDRTAADAPRFLAVENDSTTPADNSTGTQISSSDTSSVSAPQSGTITSGSSDLTTAPPASPVETSVIGGSDTTSVSAPADTSTVTITASTGTDATGSTSLTAPDTTSATEPTGTQSSTSSPSGQSGDGPGAGSTTGALSATGNGSSGAGGTLAGTTPATQSDGATSAPAGADGTTPDPNANTSSGLSPPAAGLVTPTGGGTATSTDGSASVSFTAGSVSTSVTVSVSVGGAAPAGIAAVGSVVSLKAVAGDGSQVDTFASAPILTVHYDPNGPTPSAIYYLDPVNGPTRIAGTVDTAAHTISAPLPHFSDYVPGDPTLNAGSHTNLALVYTGGNIELHDGATVVDTQPAAATDATSINFGAAGTTLTLTGSNLTGYTGPITVNEAGGGNTFILGNAFGNVSINGVAGDTLDFTTRDLVANPLTVDGSKNFTSGDGSSLTQTGTAAAHIDVNLLGGVAATLDSVIQQVKSLEQTAESAITELRNALPLLPLDTTQSVATLLGIADKINTWATSVDTQLSGLGAATTFSAVKSAIGGATNTLGITSSEDYRGAATGSHHLEVLLDLNVDKATSFFKNLNFGTQAQTLGLTVTGLQFSVDTHLTGDLTFGATTDSSTATPFLDPSSNLSFHVHAATGSVSGVTVHLNFLSATISGHATIDGTVVLSAQDPTPGDGDITLTDLSNNGVTSLISVSSPADSFDSAFTGSIGGLTATGGANIASATLTASISGSIFGSDTGPAQVNVSFTTDTSGINLIDSFSNIGPSDVLGMLQQLGTMLGSMASSSTLNLPIPFTSITVGNALDYATAFKHKFIDPLFKSGDSSQPDANGDGKFDVNDINFDSIQTLLNDLTTALGLGSPLTANFDPTTKELTFEFSFDDSLGIGTPVAIATNPVATIVQVQNGVTGTTAEIQLLAVNGTGGNFTIALNGATPVSISASGNQSAAIKSAIGSFTIGGSAIGAGNVTVTKSGNVYMIVVDKSKGDVPTLGVDSTGLTGDLHDQTVIVPGGTSRFWLAYPETAPPHLLDLTSGLSAGSDITAALNGLSGIGGGTTVTMADLSGIGPSLATGVKSPTIFHVNLSVGSPKELVGAGGFSVDFGTSLGDLASVKTSGDVIPLAQLSAHAIFGVNLNTTSVLQIAPASVTNGPQAILTTTAEGASLASVTTTQQGGSTAEIEQLTVRGGGGSFKLSGNGNVQTVSWSSPASNGDIVTALNALGGDYASPTSVTHIDTAAGRVFTITFTGTTDVAQLGADGALLTGQHEQQTLKVTSATGGTFALTDGTHTVPTESPSAPSLQSDMNGAGFSVTVTTSSIAHLGTKFVIQFSDLVNHDPLVADPSALKGALDNGVMTDDAHFELQIYNGPAVQVQTTQNAVATAGITTQTDGGRSATLTPITGGYTLTVKGLGGNFKLSFGANTVTVSVGSSAAAIQTLLAPYITGVSVIAATAAAGSTAYTITYAVAGTLTVSSTTTSQIVTTTNGSASMSEVQTLTIDGSGGPFSLGYTSGTTTSITPYLSSTISTTDLQTALNALPISGGVAVTGSIGSYTITFTNHGDQPLLLLDASSITPQNEVQKLTVTGAVGGTFSLSYKTSNATGLAWNIAASDLATAISGIVGATVVVSGTPAVIGTAGTYTITYSSGVLAGANVNPLVSNSSGLSAQNEKQTLTVFNATAGTFVLSYNGIKTPALDVTTVTAGDLTTDLTAAAGTTVTVTGSAGVFVAEFQGTLTGHDAATLVADATGLVNTTQLGASLNVTVARDNTNTSAADLQSDIQLAVDTQLINHGFTIGYNGTDASSNISTGAINAGGSASIATHQPFTATTGVPAFDIPFTVSIPVTGTPPVAIGHGTLTRGAVISLGLAVALQQAITGAIADAHVTGIGVTVTITGGGDVSITATGVGQITIDFTSPISVATGGGRASITASGAKYSNAAASSQPVTPSVDIQPRVDVSLDYADPAFQGLGLTSTPTRFDYSSGTKNEISFTLFVNGTPVAVDVSSGAAYTDVASLVTTLSSALSTALVAASLPGTAVTVCRPNLDPNATGPAQCQGTGSRIVLMVDPSVVTSLAIFVPDDLGGLPNGAITELGFASGQSATQRAHATEFFFQDVRLTGSFQFVVQQVTATASLGFLSITGTGSGTLKADGTPGGSDLLALTGSIQLKNPIAQVIGVSNFSGSNGSVQEIKLPTLPEGSPVETATFTVSDGTHASAAIPWNASAADVQAALITAGMSVTVDSLGTGDYKVTFASTGPRDPLQAVGSDETRINVDTIAAALGTGKVFYNGTLAGLSGSPRAPPTGFVQATISGGLGGTLTIAPDGYLKGVSDALGGLNVTLGITATATNWLDGIPTPQFTFSGPNFDQILDKFRNLDFGTIITGLQAIVSYLQSMAQNGGVLGDILNTQLPLVGKSINDLLNVANSVANTIHTILANPAGAIQQLNNIIASALGMVIPTAPVTTHQAGGGGFNEQQDIKPTDALHGTFTLSFKNATTTPLAYNASASDVQAALEALDTIGPGNVSVSAISGGYRVTFQGTLANTDVDPIAADATKLTKDDLISFDAAAGEIDFNFVLAFSASLTQPFNLNLQDLVHLIGSGNSFLNTIAGIASSIVGIGGNGSLSLTAQGELDLKLGLSFSAGADVTTTTAGTSTTNEVQKLHITESSGTYTLQYDANGNGAIDAGESIATPLPFNSDASAIEAALQGITALAGNVHVTGSGSDFTVEFLNGLADTNVAELSLPRAGSFFIKTGVGGTGFTASASAAVNNLNFQAKVGPFGLFVKDGHAAIGASISAHLVDVGGTGRFEILHFAPGTFTSDFSNIAAFFTADSVTLDGTAPGCAAHELACASLPIFVGTSSTQVPIDFGSGNPGSDNTLTLDFTFTDFATLISSPADAFHLTYHLPNWNDFHFDAPSILTLLSDPSTIVDGLDTILSTLQDVLGGEIFGANLPLIGSLLSGLKNNPLVKAISDFRTNWLQPLAQLIRENNLDIDGLVQLIEDSVIGVLSNLSDPSSNPFSLMPDPFTTDGQGHLHSSDIQFNLLDAGGNTGANIFTAQAAQFDFTLGHSWSFTADPIDLDIGIPALGIQARFTPQLNISFALHFGFGVSLSDGFYFVTHPPGDPTAPELSLSVAVNFSSVDCPSGSVDQSNINGQLLFLALKIKDGVDLNNDGKISVQCDGNHQAPVNAQTNEISGLFFNGSIDIADPNNDGRLTFSELASSSLSDIIKPSINGGAMLRADATVDFSTLGPDLGNILPSISTQILIDFGFAWNTTDGFQLSSPQVVFADVTLDLGSFISDFAGPILRSIKQVLDPLSWLIGPDGFLNMRIPLLSDLAGHKITGADLVAFFDPQDGPAVKGFLAFVNELYHLVDLVDQVSSEGPIKLNFGDMIIVEGDHPATPDPHQWAIVDKAFSLGLPSLPGDAPDISGLKDFSNLSLPGSLPSASTEGGDVPADANEFSSGVSQQGGIDFPLLDNPSILFNLLLGKPVKLVEITLPELSFNFFYRQSFPIIGPLVGTFAGGFGAKLDVRLGYDTYGLQQFISTGNPAELVEGFFFDTKDAKGNLLPLATLDATIAVGAGIDLGLIKAGVEGGITITIHFSWDDLNKDGVVRFSEMAANILANSGDPLAVFDIDGDMQLFLRAYVTIDLFVASFTLNFEFARVTLFHFSVPFNRPSYLGTVSNGVLTLSVGPASHDRIQGNLNDIGESITVSGSGHHVDLTSAQFNVPSPILDFSSFDGINKIVANFGAGDDTIDLSGLNSSDISVLIHMGDGNDTVIGPTKAACDSNGICAQIFGDAGNDHLTAMSTENDVFDGGAGNDTLDSGLATDGATFRGGDGADTITGGSGASNETIDPGAGDDTIDGGGGTDTYLGLSVASVVHINTADCNGCGTLDLSGRAENITFTLQGGTIVAGWGALSAGHYAHEIDVAHVGAIGHIIGGKGTDTFDVSETQPGGDTFHMILDGGKGNDTYNFNVDNGTRIDAQVTDNGDPWNSGDQIVVNGQDSATDYVTVRNDKICASSTGTPTCSGTNDIIRYTSPNFDANVLAVFVHGNGGDDQISVESTSGTVPVMVDGGLGNDLITVGNATHGLNDIVGISRPNVNQPDGVGPVQVVGGSGHDTLIVDDSADSNANTGRLTSFMEKRQGAPVTGDEIGIVSGLGMQLFPTSQDFNANTNVGAGRVEFEGVESVDVKLSGGADTLAIGGDTGLLGTGPDALPQGRQALILGFTSTPSAALTIEGNGGADTFRVFGTNTFDRDILNGTGFLQVSTIADGIHLISDEQQVLSIPRGVFGFFTLTFGGNTTDLLPLSASASDIKAALNGLSGLSGKVDVAIPPPNAPGQFLVDFDKSLGDVDPLVATLTPKVSTTGTHQYELDMPTGSVGVGFFTLTGSFGTTAELPMDATPTDINAALVAKGVTPTSVVGAAGKFTIKFGSAITVTGATILPLLTLQPTGVDNTDQYLTVPDISYGTGYFTLQYDYQETKPISLATGDSGIADALNSLQLLDSHSVTPYVTVSHVHSGGATVFKIHFDTTSIGTAVVLVARLTPLYIDAGAGDDNLRVQANFEQLFFFGGDGADNVTLSADALTHQALTADDVVPSVTITPPASEQQTITLAHVTGGQFAIVYNGHQTRALGYDVSPELIQAALLDVLTHNGFSSATGADLSVQRVFGGYAIQFLDALAGHGISLSVVGSGSDAGTPFALLSNGLAAVVTVDGGNNGDQYTVNTIGGSTASLINVFDSGSGGTDSLTINGTTNPDYFLLRAATSESGLAFVALINAPDPTNIKPTDPVERVNYDTKLEHITLNTITNSDITTGDNVYVDDTRSIIDINGGDGPDFFQVGQLYKSRRTPSLAGVAHEDVFATIETTQGWLSNGITNPMTINGGDGNDTFIVFHNLAVLDLNGDNGDDTFLVQAFALAGSQDDFRALTDLSGGAGADLIQYAVNAPVNIDGGDGFDTVIVIGTEFADDFVITKDGVFGAGLNVNFVNIESLEVDGGAGDDRFFVLSTGITFKTTITGGLGNDLISVQGPTPANGVISNDLLGHSGIITHDVEQTVTPDQYSGLKVVGISGNVVDNDTYGVVLLQSDGYSQVIQDASAGQQGVDSYQVVLSRPPVAGSFVVVTALPPTGLVLLDSTNTPIRTLSNTQMLITLGGVTDGTFTLSDGSHTTAPIAYNASGDDVHNALDLVGIHNVDVTQDGPTYTLEFKGGYTGTDVAVLSLVASGFVGGTGSIQVTQHGGVSIAGGINLCFDSGDGACAAIPVDAQDPAGTAFYQAQTVKFEVDDNVPNIPMTGDIQHRVTVGPDAPLPPPLHPTTIVGHVFSATSIDSDTIAPPPNQTDSQEDANPLGGGDEFGTVQTNPLGSEAHLFNPYLPSDSLPEGLRGQYLKITGGDLEASGQIRLIEGSYRTNLTVSGNFTLTFGGVTVGSFDASTTAGALQAAIAALAAIGTGNVTVSKTGSTFTIDLGSNLYLSNDAHFTVSGSASAGIDDGTLKLNAPWDVTPNGPDPGQKAQFEIELYSAVQVPNVRVRIFTKDTPAIVVDENSASTTVLTNGSTSVSEYADGSLTAATAIADGLVDTIRVRLSADPGAPVTVSLTNQNQQLEFFDSSALTHQITSLAFDHSTWDTFQTVWVRAIPDGVVENFHKADLQLSLTGYIPYSTVVDVGDNNYPGVRVIESNGTTTVVESPTQFGASETGYPVSDTYTLSLTQAPTGASSVVTVTATAQPTRTTQTGAIVSFSQQLVLCLVHGIIDCTNPSDFGSQVTPQFDATNWYVPQTVVVRAKGNDRVDGQDTHVFAPTLDLLNNIQGPLFINGGEGTDRTGLLEREPLMLPRERNLKPAMGAVITATEGSADGSVPATITIDASTITGSNQMQILTLVDGSSTKNEQQQLTINAIGGTFKLKYQGVETSVALPYDASALQVQNALNGIPALSGVLITVAKNSNQFLITFHSTTNFDELTTENIDLQPVVAADLKTFTIEITSGPAKNKQRIITNAVDLGGGVWMATLDHLWLSPFNNDTSVPTSDSTYTLEATNPNLLVDEKTATDILWVYDDNNPASFNDPAYSGVSGTHPGQDNPAAVGSLTYETSNLYDHTAAVVNPQPLDQFRIQGFGMGLDRTIAQGTDGAALEPGGITFKDVEDLQLTLGPGNDKFTVDNTPPGAKVTIDAGDGNDVVYVNKISGHTAVDLGQGTDTLNVDQATQTLAQLYGLLTVSGDIPQAVVTNLVNGSPAQGTVVDAVNAQQRIDVQATGGNYRLTVSDGSSTYTTGDILWSADAATVASAINTAYGVHGHVTVRKAGHTYYVTFDGTTAAMPIPLIVSHDLGLTNGADAGDTLNVYDNNATAPDAVLLTSSSLSGLDTPQTNEIQQIVLDATSGTFTLSDSYVGVKTVTDGGSGGNEVQAVTVLPGATGTFTLTFNGHSTAPLQHNVSTDDLRTALEGLPGSTVGDFAVVKSANAYVITFQGTLANTNVGQLVAGGFGGDTPLTEAYNVGAATLQHDLQALPGIGAGNVVVSLMDDVYVLRFQGALSNTDVPQIAANGAALLKRSDPLGGCSVDASGLNQVGCNVDLQGSATASTRVDGFAQTVDGANLQAAFGINNVQVLTMAATGGTYTLSLLLSNPTHTVVTAAIPFDATADVVRQALQNAIVANDPRLVFKFDVMVDRYRDGLDRNIYVIGFQGNLRLNNGGPGANFLGLDATGLTGTASLATRMDGLEYFGIENLNVDTGSASDILSVQGTSSGSNGFTGAAVTNMRLHNGDDKVFISSNADQDLSSWQNVDFLTGNLDDLRGALNIDLGTGRHELFMSDQASMHNDSGRSRARSPGTRSRSTARRSRRSPTGRRRSHTRSTRPAVTCTTASPTGRAPATTPSQSARSRARPGSGRRPR